MAGSGKRKAIEQGFDDSYDSDEITVAPATSTPRALRHVPVQQAQNKRRRIADCVLIPVSRETRKLIADINYASPRSRANQSTLSRTPSDSEDVLQPEASLAFRGSTSRRHTQQAEQAIATTRSAGVGECEDQPMLEEAGNGRSRRSGQRVSYVQKIDYSDDSADELSIAAPAPVRKSNPTKTSKKATSDSSDFEDDAAEVVSEDYSSGDNSEELESGVSIEDESEDDMRPTKRRRQVAEASSHKADRQSQSAEKKQGNTLSKQMLNLAKAKGLDLSLPPLHKIDDIFSDLTSRALPLGLDEALQSLAKKKLRVATMCSGTESPLLAVEMIRDSLRSMNRSTFDIEHLFSAEKEPFKQAYIERNFNPPIIFRDIMELIDAVDQDYPTAITAYGGEVPVPTNIDILVAGTSCVDFSAMNSHRKDITDIGESGDTWRAVLTFCKAFRPAMVILENVKTAKWDYMLQDYKDAGYEPVGAYVDTKNYYIPQTRQRGYMACFDKNRLQDEGVSSAGSKWHALMEQLQRRASSPVSSFLLPANRIEARPLQINENAKDVDWSRCEITQMAYRLQKGLGVSRPITQWSESGFMLPPDHGSRAWHSAQVERVLDTLDAATLRKARDGYDARFKTRVWDVSQNLHYLADSSQFGIIGCITPSGINFISDSWRAMTPEECLALQGIPLNKISFTVETKAHIQDLAGNAMSGPLVGTAILSGLIAGHKMFGTQGVNDEIGTQGTNDEQFFESKSNHARQEPQDKPELISSDMQSVNIDPRAEPIDVAHLLQDAERALRRCYCEGGQGMTKHAIQRCTDCSHTTCTSCGGNPEHNYSQSHYLNAGRTSLASFEERLRSKLPLQLKLQDLPPGKHGNRHFDETVRPLAAETFSLTSVRRSHCIKVLYTAPTGHLELRLTEGRAVWYLFADAPPNLASNALLREMLAQPVAESVVERSLLEGTLRWRNAEENTATVKIAGSGDRLPTWWARMQMPDYANHWQWEFLQIESPRQEIAGRYQYLPHCGTACETLYKRVDPQGSQPLYFFLDPTRVRPADEDCFVFAHDHSMLDYDERRRVLACVDATWRPWQHGSENKSNQSSTKIKYHEWSSWSTRLEPAYSDLALNMPANMTLAAESAPCQQAIVAMSARVDDKLDMQTRHATKDGFVPLNDDNFFSKTAWIFEAMRRHLPTNEWIDMPSSTQTTSCEDCAPTKPSLRWMLTGDGSIAPYEDPRSAAHYERAIKGRSPPVLVQAEENLFRFGVNLASLAHRASARLASTSTTGEVNFYWRLSTSASTETSTRKFLLRPTKDVHPYEKDLHMSVGLYPNQRMALAWMKDQEGGRGRDVLLEDAEEAFMPHLGWRVEVRAQTTHFAKGGICADHPGFGKTVTSLALIHSEWQELGAEGISKSLMDGPKTTGVFKSTATVVVCPKLLLDQWLNEACEKWGSEEGIIAVKSADSLAKLSIADFESAKLVIVSRQTLASEAYTERLAAHAAMPGPATDRGRAYAEWLKHATEQLPEHLEILKKSGKAELVKRLDKKYLERVNSEDFVGYVPAKRLKGREYAEASLARSKAGKTKASQTKAKVPSRAPQKTLIEGPLFEMFFFNRIIVDEFHSCVPKEFETITALKADKRWGLSGTPQHSDCYDVAQIGRLLGVPLRIGSIQRGVMKFGNIKALNAQMTDFEKFEASRTALSGHQNGRIQELAQNFLDTFVRRNVMDFEGLSVKEHLVPTSLGVVHHATYHELSQHLNSSDMKIRKSTKTRKTDRDQQFADAVERSDTAEEALSKSASYPRRADASLRQSTLDDWISKREKEARSLTDELESVILEACKKEPQEYFGWREARINADKLEDKETADIVKDLCRKADGGRTAASVKGVKVDSSAGSKRQLTSEVNKLVNRLLSSRRSVRYLQNVKQMQSLAVASKTSLKHCHHPECRTKLSTDSRVAVSGLCGHLICADCYTCLQAKKETGCPADGCRALLASHHLLWNHKLKNIRGARHSEHGAKLDAAISILEKIQAKRQQAVLFVQFESQLAEVERALASTSIPHIVVSTARQAAAQLATFTEDPDKTAVVFNASSEASEGLNLQNANHVLFLSPLLRDSQYSYESTMAQAVGRVRRHGQQKEIHVYRFVALNTIDVDILEHRERRNEALVEEAATDVKPPGAARMPEVTPTRGNKEPEAERVQLVVEDGKFSLRPQSWLVKCGTPGSGGEDGNQERVKGRRRVRGWEDFSSLVKFSRVFVEDDE